MAAALEQHHAQPQPARHHRQDRAAEARPDDGEVNVHCRHSADGRRHPLLAVHLRQTCRARRRAAAVEQPLDVPEIGEHRTGRLAEAWPSWHRTALPAPPTRDRGGRGAGRCSTGSASMAPLPPRVGITAQTGRPRPPAVRDRAAAPTPPPRGAARTAGRAARTRAARWPWRARKAAARRSPRRVIRLLSAREHLAVRRLEPDGHFERPPTQVAKAPGTRRRARPPGTPDATRRSRGRTRPPPRRSPRRRPTGIACGSKKLPALYSLIWRAGGSVASASRICRGDGAARHRRRRACCTHRSHITQRNGHSRLVRKTTAVGRQRAGLVALLLPHRGVGALRDRATALGPRGRGRTGRARADGRRRSARARWRGTRHLVAGAARVGVRVGLAQPLLPQLVRTRAGTTPWSRARAASPAHRPGSGAWARTGMSTPVTAFTPARTTSCLSVISRAGIAAQHRARTASPPPRQSTERLGYGENAVKP